MEMQSVLRIFPLLMLDYMRRIGDADGARIDAQK